jgi:Lrp/AsnC family transcriptional regulator for asnA, asnC and gidA
LGKKRNELKRKVHGFHVKKEEERAEDMARVKSKRKFKNSKKDPGPRDIDEIDRKVILELQDDARAPYKDIGRRLRISEGTVRNRVMKLIDRGILKLEARVDPFALPHKISALVGVNLRERDPEQKMREIQKIPGVTSVWNATGRYDLFFEVMVDSLQELNKLLFNIDRNYVGGVSGTETFITLSSETKSFKLS